jgi:hypothetical protein
MDEILVERMGSILRVELNLGAERPTPAQVAAISVRHIAAPAA